jgi:hypothetical protein
MSNNNYVIKGTVLGKSGKALAGFEITALDKDLIGSDTLGTTKTDAHGRFEIQYSEAQFSGFLEKGPDIYLLVKNDQGQAVHITENAIRHNAGQEEVYHIVLDDAEALQPSIQLERFHFTKLIAKNPNYFGTMSGIVNPDIMLPNPVIVKWDQHTYYEELDCVGLRRAENILEAVFHVKRPNGFGGPRCKEGSTEWVTFWIDYQDGAGWILAGSPVAVNVHDLGSADEKGIYYAAKLKFTPAHPPISCKTPQVVRLRAVLSWQVPHFNPNTLPVWGNRKDAWILLRSKFRIDPGQFAIDFPNVFELPKGPFGQSQLAAIQELHHDLGESLEAAKASLAHVEPHRADMHKLLTENPNYFGNISMGKSLKELEVDFKQLPQSAWESFPSLVDISKLLPKIQLQDNTKYEQVTCLGLYPEEDLLEATVAIKLPTGYVTDPCHVGSPEYVAYYIDYGSGWEYVGTDKFQVHDVADDLIEPGKPKKPLMYGSRMFVKDMRKRALECSKEQVILAKAILSWNFDPTPFGPNYHPTWGNAIERRIEVRPPLGQFASPILTEVSEVNVALIDANGLANNDGSGFIRPFGYDLAIEGEVNVSGATHYRLQYRENVFGSPWQNSMAPRSARMGAGTVHKPVVGTGWFSIADYLIDKTAENDTMLCHFDSYPRNGQYLLRIQVGNDINLPADSLLPASSNEVTVLLDNKYPSLYPFIGVVIPNQGVTVLQPCGLFIGDTPIQVWGNFEDLHYASYNLALIGGGILGAIGLPLLPVGPNGTVPAGNPSTGQLVSEFRMLDVFPTAIKCAYGIILTVRETTIAGSAGNYQFVWSYPYTQSSVTFDWEP